MNKNIATRPVMNAKGVGPAIMLRTSPFILAAVILELYFSDEAEVSFLNGTFSKTAGIVWLTMGLICFVTTIIQFSISFPKNKLITGGMYACSRNPIYSSWILFIFPALAVILNNLMFLVSAIIMGLITVNLVKSEESILRQHFGDAYINYKKRVRCLAGLSTGRIKDPSHERA